MVIESYVFVVTLVMLVAVMFWDFNFHLKRNKQMPFFTQVMYSGFVVTLVLCIANAP